MNMRKIKLLLFTFCFCVLFMNAQVPQGIQYQGIARDNTGSVYQNAALTVRFDIHTGTATGSVVYSEDHSLTTNGFGLFTAVIGNGTVNSGTFPGINWASGAKFLEVSVGGT